MNAAAVIIAIALLFLTGCGGGGGGGGVVMTRTNPSGGGGGNPTLSRPQLPNEPAAAAMYFNAPYQNPCGNSPPSAACWTFFESADVRDRLRELAAAYPSVARVTVIGMSIENREIPAIKISDNPNRNEESEASVLIIGGTHAREWIAVNVPLLIAEYLLANSVRDDIKALIDRAEIWIAPLINPDGRDYASSQANRNLWRKNRRKINDVDYGVDLNRNHNFQWGYDNIGSSMETGTQTYRGPSAFSEPESKAVCFLAHQIQPDISVSYHNFSQLILYPWGYTDEAAIDSQAENVHRSIAEQMSRRMRQVHGRTYTFGDVADQLNYYTNGDFTDWMFGVFRSPSFTVELPPPLANPPRPNPFVLPEEEIDNTFEENLPGAITAIRWAIENPNANSPLRNAEADCGN